MGEVAAAGTPLDAIPGVTAPMRRALAGAGYTTVESLAEVDYATLAALHGVGARGLARLQQALVDRGLSLAGVIPPPPEATHSLTSGHTGNTAPDMKTRATEYDPHRFIADLPTRRKTHGEWMLRIFGQATDAAPVMWGPEHRRLRANALPHRCRPRSGLVRRRFQPSRPGHHLLRAPP